MSFRSSIIRSARSAARPTINRSNNVVGKRMASTGEHKSSGNMPWAIGSAAVFGSLAAFILAPSGGKAAHDVHDKIDAKGAGQHVAAGAVSPSDESEHHDNAKDLMRKEREAGTRETLTDKKDLQDKPVHAGENRPRTEIPTKRDDRKPYERGASTGEKFDGTIDGKHAKVETDSPDVKGGEGSKKEAEKKTSGGDAGEGDDKGKDGDEPSKEDVKNSIKQAEKSNAPKVAMDDEEKSS